MRTMFSIHEPHEGRGAENMVIVVDNGKNNTEK